MGTTNNTSPSYNKGKGYFNKYAIPVTDRIVLNDVAVDGSVALPAFAVVRRMQVNNKTANAVTGGLDVGLALNGTELASAQAVAASTEYDVAATVIPIVSKVAQTIFYKAHTGWNSANLDLVFELSYFPNV